MSKILDVAYVIVQTATLLAAGWITSESTHNIVQYFSVITQ